MSSFECFYLSPIPLSLLKREIKIFLTGHFKYGMIIISIGYFPHRFWDSRSGRRSFGWRDKVVRYLLILFLLIPLFWGIACSKKPKSGSQPGLLAPDFVLPALDGQKVRLSDYRGQVVLLNFFATWCPPCRAEVPDFVELYRYYRDRGLVIIGIALDRGNPQVLDHFVREYGINYPLLLGDQKVVRAYGGIKGIPTTFLIDRRGRVRKKYLGYRPRSVYERDLCALLSESKG